MKNTHQVIFPKYHLAGYSLIKGDEINVEYVGDGMVVINHRYFKSPVTDTLVNMNFHCKVIAQKDLTGSSPSDTLPSVKEIIIKIEKRVEELCTQTWTVTGHEARQVLLDEIRWLESLINKL